ncbi:beta-eliminating lyase [Pseudomassariella vexata]|uniref:Beta-eliminating lyase n=1 Tax=Pseudomassariella vexata TaxID=1141098 RepID=A0A1Y2EA96_9PEZI|nr:beta-eliminating lyase [Pseudomassariella vexata]ORY68508.1 beta-eliminating lyase [Pseudomassariella vexata]
MASKKGNGHWGNPIQTGSAFDFRSDVITTPSLGMLEAIQQATLNDDVYGEDQTTRSFENQIAAMCGKEAAVLVVSGTMANQLSIRALLHQPPYSILADSQAHIIHFEAGGLAHLSGAMVQAIRPMNGLYITLADIEKHAILSDQPERCPTKTISIENTAHGNIIPLNELHKIKYWAAKHGIGVHIDGARLWHAVVAGAGTLEQFASYCDALTLSFNKALGAPMGAMVVGSQDLIKRVRRLRQSIGGGVRQTGIMAAMARQAVLDNFGAKQVDSRGELEKTHDMAKMLGRAWTDAGGRLLRPVETNMVWLDMKSAGISIEAFNEMGKRHGILVNGKRIMVHHQICEAANQKLTRMFDELLTPIQATVSGIVLNSALSKNKSAIVIASTLGSLVRRKRRLFNAREFKISFFRATDKACEISYTGCANKTGASGRAYQGTGRARVMDMRCWGRVK